MGWQFLIQQTLEIKRQPLKEESENSILALAYCEIVKQNSGLPHQYHNVQIMRWVYT